MAAAPCCMAGHPSGHCPKPGRFDAEEMCCSDCCQGPLHKILVLFVHENCKNIIYNYFVIAYNQFGWTFVLVSIV